MAKRRGKGDGNGRSASKVDAYRHESAKRKNNPPAKIAAEGTVPVIPKVEYAYNPHLPPVLRFDATGQTDKLPDLLAKATQQPLTQDEARLLAEALRNQQPWLEWSNKRETQAKGFTVDPVALHIHERVSAQAILKVAARQDPQKDLFAEPELEYHQAVQFYRHDIDWTNRLILGDSLQVMSSLARREDLAGKVQMIYMDPPYGIKFKSNFQPEIGRRTVTDREQDLTRELEMVKAYRDTWHLGIHSYLSYLRDRVVVARELLADRGSLFIQIGDENIHVVRNVLDEVFGAPNFVGLITIVKTAGASSDLLPGVNDYLLWYAKDKDQIKYRQLYHTKTSERGAGEYKYVLLADGQVRSLISEEACGTPTPPGARRFRPSATTSQRPPGSDPLTFQGKVYRPGRSQYWKTNITGLERLGRAGRLVPRNESISYLRCLDDFPVSPINNLWLDARWGFDATLKKYVVETNPTVIEHCILMTTDPGDLVLDPTCGSGATAFVAEQWGRRWITADTSRVAIAIARQRLLTMKTDFYSLRSINTEDCHRSPVGIWLTDPTGKIPGACTFRCKTVPHITLKSIAQNQNLDPIFAKHEPVLDERLKACNAALGKVNESLRAKLAGKLATKAREQGKKSITDADTRRWELPRGTGFQPVNHGQDAHATNHATNRGQPAHAHTHPPATFDPRFVEIREGAYLPHWRQAGAAYSVTFRLNDSLPQDVLAAWVSEREEIVRRAAEAKRPLTAQELRRLYELHSERVEKYLDASYGACYMNDPQVAQVVRDALLHFDGQRYDLAAWCVMPNHVHVVVWPRPGHDLSGILHSWKSFTSNQANKLLDRTGPFWQKESFDHLLRDAEDFDRAMRYVLSNPQQAGLKEWPWTGRGTGFQPVDHGQDVHATNQGQDAPATQSKGWEHWQVPFDTDPDWPEALQQAVTEYRKAWRAKMDEINACIAANAEQEELVDQPEVVKGVVRVSGPFTVEAVQPPEMSLSDNIDPHTAGQGMFDGEPEALPEGFEARTLRVVEPRPELDAKNIDAYLDQMLRLLRMDGVRFPNNRQMHFTRLDHADGAVSGLVAEGRWVVEGQEDPDPQGKANVAVAIGPQYGPVTAQMVVETRAAAIRMGYADLVIAGFSFDGAAQDEVEGFKTTRIRSHLAHIRPDVNPGMAGLLKEQPGSQLFTVFGQPRTCLEGPDKDGQYTATMEGVDIYNPVDNSIVPTGADKVAAWFLDSDYDGRTFCITQAFFPDKSAWEKLAKALNGPNGVIDAERFETFSGTTSLPFPMGKHKCVAVKVIDPRGNEVMRVHRIGRE